MKCYLCYAETEDTCPECKRPVCPVHSEGRRYGGPRYSTYVVERCSECGRKWREAEASSAALRAKLEAEEQKMMDELSDMLRPFEKAGINGYPR